jgi:hypothetical protein
VSSTLLVVPGGNILWWCRPGSFRVAGETQDDADARVLAAIARFVTANS